MNPIGVLIVEDKPIVAEGIKATLKKYGIGVLDICSSGQGAIDAASRLKPDLILMDIELEGAMDGISAAEVIRANTPCAIIYLTDYTDKKTVDRAKLTFPANFLSKPFNEMELVRAIEIAANNQVHHATSNSPARNTKVIFVRTDLQKFIKLEVDEILYLEADRAYSNIVTETQSFKLSTSMNHVQEQLSHDHFLRIHRKYTVNLRRITGLNGNVIKVGEKEVQMSKEYRDELMKRLKIIR